MNSDLAISEIVSQFAETELRKFFRASEIGSGQVLISDCNGTIEYVNPAFCRVTGYSSQEVVGKTPAILKSGRMSAVFYQHCGPLEALTIFDRTGEKINLILTDVIMPDMSGPEMAKKMRLKHPDVKLLIMSGYSEEKLDSLDFSGEQMQFMTKPFSPADLAKLVHKCLSEDTTTHGEQKE